MQTRFVMTKKILQTKNKRPLTKIVLGTFLVFMTPFFLNLFDAELGYGTKQIELDGISELNEAEIVQIFSNNHRRVFLPVILEWSSFCIVLFSYLASFVYYLKSIDITLPLISMWFLCSGCFMKFAPYRRYLLTLLRRGKYEIHCDRSMDGFKNVCCLWQAMP